MPMVDSKTETLRNFVRHHRTQPRSIKLDADGAETWQAVLVKVEQLINSVAVEVNGVMNDLTLTQQGQLERLAKIGPRVCNNFSNIGIVLNQADQAKARLEKVLYGPPTQAPGGNEIVEFLKQQEIRSMIGKGNANAEFLKAVERDDVETTVALLAWPGGSPITDDIKGGAEKSYATRTNPGALEKLKFVEYLHEHVSVLAEQISQWLIHLGAAPESVQKAVRAKE